MKNNGLVQNKTTAPDMALFFHWMKKKNEAVHDKTNKMAYAPSEDSD